MALTASATASMHALRYHGSKHRIAPWIVSHLSAHVCYVETHGGSAGVLLTKPRSKLEVYNDLDGEVVNFFRILRDRGDELARAVELTPFARAEYELSYEPCDDDDPLEQARRFFVRCWQSRHGSSPIRSGWRFQRDLQERNHSKRFAQEVERGMEAMLNVAARLKGVQIECDDALNVIGRYDAPTTLFYVDPPYLHGTRVSIQNGHRMYAQEMSDDDHCQLAEALNSIKGMAIISGYSSPLYDELYRGWQVVTRREHKESGAFSVECLWLSPRASEVAVQKPLFEINQVGADGKAR
jgi:DNA adenine methylase